MRADRLVSLVLLLRRRGRMTAEAIAAELEVSSRTVLRDVEALSVAGVPVYAERGRHGGFALLPGFRTELAGLTHDEALALLTAGSGRAGQVFGLGPALGSAMRKVVDALPESRRSVASDAVARILIEPETDLLSRRQVSEEIADNTVTEVRRAVLAGHKLRIHYAASGAQPRWRTVDPVGLVTVRARAYLLALVDGRDRTYRLSRMCAARELPEPSERPDDVDLDRLWADRCARFLSRDHIAVQVLVHPARREELLDTARAVRSETTEDDGLLRLDVSFEDLRHAVWAVWQLGADAVVLAPDTLRTALRERAELVASRYR